MSMDLSPHIKAGVDLINRSQKILLVSHRRPDGDTLGASLGLYHALVQLGKAVVPACIDDIPQRLSFIPGTNRFVHDFNFRDFDLIIISDAGAYYMTGFHEKYPDFFSKEVPILNIDHHASNEGFGTVNIVDPKASCATMLVWRLVKFLPITMNREIALSLMTGIYNDTGGFMHSNTTQETFEMAKELSAYSFSVSEIVQPMFRQATHEQLRVWGHVLENLKQNEDKVVASVMTHDDFRSLGAHSSDTGGIVDLMNTIPDAKFTMLLAEDDGVVKGSLRTQQEDINVSDIAGNFGGGGHRKASGFRVPGRLKKQTVWRIVPA